MILNIIPAFLKFAVNTAARVIEAKKADSDGGKKISEDERREIFAQSAAELLVLIQTYL